MFRESLPEMQMARPIAPSDRAYRFRVSRIAGGATIFGAPPAFISVGETPRPRAADQAIAAAQRRRVSNRVVKTLDGVIS